LNDILYVGNNALGSYPTIQSALNAAKDGDSIYVYDDSSPYYESIIIDKSVIIQGENKYTTIIDGRGDGTVVFIKANDVEMSDFSIRNSGSNSPSAGIMVNADNVLLSHLIVSSSFYGIRFDFSYRNTCSYISIVDTVESGISLYESTENRISNSMVSDTKTGIEIVHASNYNMVYANAFLDCTAGIVLRDSSQNSIYWNTITNNEQGILLERADENDIYNENVINDNTIGISLINSDENEIYDMNSISDNSIGIQLFLSSGNNIHENIIDENEYGVRINRSQNNDIYWNQILKNYYGVYLSESNGNQMYLNNIEDNNHFGVFLSFCKQTKIAYNNFIENYISSSF
jgi:parallel beta-helix repeat protein